MKKRMYKRLIRKHIASVLTVGRAAGAFVLLLLEPLSASFFTVYALCCASD